MAGPTRPFYAALILCNCLMPLILWYQARGG